jgi:peptidoglycan/xylan/chitin deacetylase (PgdA/CDA1 family)
VSVDVLVLCYHAVSPTWDEHVSVTPDDLHAQVEGLLRRGYRPATFTQAVTAPPAGRVLAVTFDDAYRSVGRWARPVLDALGVSATLFVPTGLVGTRLALTQEPYDGPEADAMDWQELRALGDAGWEIGSHTVSHPMLTREDDAGLAHQLGDSRAELQRRLQRPCPSLAYPYGDGDARVMRAAREAGYTAAATLFPGRIARPDPLGWPRVGVSHHHGPRGLRVKASRTVRALRGNPAVLAASRGVYRFKAFDPPRRPEAMR